MKRFCALACAAALLAMGGAIAHGQEASQRPALLVSLQLPLQGNADRLFRGKLQRAVDRLTTSTAEGGLRVATAENPEQQRQRPLLVIEFVAPKEGEASEFERAVGLARFLTSESLAGVKTLAYLPESLDGHAVLVALACEEIAMAPDAEIGAAASAEDPTRPIEPAIRAMYEQIAESRRTAPPPLVVGMVDRRAEVLRVETDRGIEYALGANLETIEEESVVVGSDVLSPAGELARFTGREGREIGFVRYLTADRESLARTLALPPERLVEDQSIAEAWRPVMVDLSGPVTTKSARRLQSLLGAEIDQGANWVGVRIESSGGDWVAALSLARTLAELADGEARTVAYVPQRAEGPGALVALACDQLVMQSGAKIGGIEPGQAVQADNVALRRIEDNEDEQEAQQGEDEQEAEKEQPQGLKLGAGPKPAEQADRALEQTETVVATLRESLAAETARTWSLLAATIDPEIEVALYADRQTGAQRFFSKAELDEQEDPGAWRLLEVVKPAGDTLKLDSARAAELGVAWQEIDQFDDLATLYGFTEPPRTAEPNWALELVEALASPGFAAMLLVVGIVGLYIELSSPGLGLGGFIAAVAFLLFFWSKFLDGTADWLEVLLFVTGVVFILIELVVIPGFGIFGLGGILMLLSSLVLASQTFVLPKTDTQLRELRDSLAVVAGSMLAFVVAAVVLRQYLPQSALFRRAMLHPPEEADLVEQQRREALADYEHLIGATGAATTDLLPGGRAEIEGEILDVVTSGEMIDRGEPIEVVSAHANRVLVRRVRT